MILVMGTSDIFAKGLERPSKKFIHAKYSKILKNLYWMSKKIKLPSDSSKHEKYLSRYFRNYITPGSQMIKIIKMFIKQNKGTKLLPHFFGGLYLALPYTEKYQSFKKALSVSYYLKGKYPFYTLQTYNFQDEDFDKQVYIGFTRKGKKLYIVGMSPPLYQYLQYWFVPRLKNKNYEEILKLK